MTWKYYSFYDKEMSRNWLQPFTDIINGSLKRFRTPKIIEIERLEGGLNIVELFHGTTLAFKDLALSVVGGLLDFFLKENSEHVTVLIG